MNAGHNPPLLVRADGAVETLSDGGLVLGMFETVAYDGGRVEMRPGDTLLVFSDGVTETWNPDGEEFGEEGLVAARGAQPRRSTPRRSRTPILRELERFAAGAKATDDRTIVVLKRD